MMSPWFKQNYRMPMQSLRKFFEWWCSHWACCIKSQRRGKCRLEGKLYCYEKINLVQKILITPCTSSAKLMQQDAEIHYLMTFLLAGSQRKVLLHISHFLYDIHAELQMCMLAIIYPEYLKLIEHCKIWQVAWNIFWYFSFSCCNVCHSAPVTVGTFHCIIVISAHFWLLLFSAFFIMYSSHLYILYCWSACRLLFHPTIS
jgi:hypothetical protein